MCYNPSSLWCGEVVELGFFHSSVFAFYATRCLHSPDWHGMNCFPVIGTNLRVDVDPSVAFLK